MRNAGLRRYAVCSCAATVLLAGCGVSEVPTEGLAVTSNSGETLPYSTTFHFTGTKQWFRVPAGVKWLTVVARGASGGYNPSEPRGGLGGRIYAVVPVNPGERLAVVVGGSGARPAGGFNGGAKGGVYPEAISGGGGGGASDVRQGGDRIENRILVAGGGGGQGAPLDPDRCYYSDSIPDGNGGKGGADTGGAGQVGCGPYGVGGGGAGGNQYYGGQGGEGGSGFGKSGKRGSLAMGGRGGAGCLGTNPCGEPGGGGGGGYFGGGGGGAGTVNDIDALGGGGGGGGSSYIEPSAKAGRMWQGWHKASGDGLIVFSW